VVERGDCMFVEKARVLQSLGAVGGIVLDSTEGTAAATSPLFAMSGDGVDDISIPMVFLFMEEARHLLEVLKHEPDLEVTLEEKPPGGADHPEEVEEEGEDETTLHLKSAVHAFLEKNNQQKTHSLRSPDGAPRTVRTVEKLNNGVGSVKILKIDEMLQEVTTEEEAEEEELVEEEVVMEEEEESEEEYLARTGQDGGN